MSVCFFVCVSVSPSVFVWFLCVSVSPSVFVFVFSLLILFLCLSVRLNILLNYLDCII